MKISYLDKKELNKFIQAKDHNVFLQSFEWGDLQKKIGNDVFRIAVVDDKNNVEAVAEIIKKKLFLNKSYFYCPRGPIFKNDNKETISFLFKGIKKLAKKEKAVFLRFEPINLNVLKKAVKFKKTVDVQPKSTLILNLEKSEEDLLKGMHHKTRYNIRLAGKKGVEVFEGDKNNFDDFWKLMKATSDRDRFKIHNKEHYLNLVSMNNDFIKIYLCRYEGTVVSAGIFSFFGDTLTYLHGASSNEYRNVMAPYLLQWNMITLGKKLNKKYYDFYGISEKKWPGVTRFKLGFGGEQVSYGGTLDTIYYHNLYLLYNLLRFIKRWWR